MAFIYAVCNNSLLCFSFNFYRNDASVLTTFVSTFLESDYAVYQCVKSMVLTHTYVCTGIVNCAALANNDVTGYTLLSTENLYA